MSDDLLIKSGEQWDFKRLEELYVKLAEIAERKYGLDIYSNQMEIISSEQMLDAYAANGMPVFYSHWSMGEDFLHNQKLYKRGHMGLAYEIVINSNPCVAYLMEENTMLMQALVIAHASFGHNFVFKNNYLFKEWTNADTILDYLEYAKKFVRDCEEEYGYERVEATLDAAHALQMHGIDKYKKPIHPTAAEEENRRLEREAYIQSQVNEIWKTVPISSKEHEKELEERFPSEDVENILRFLEESAPRLEDWQRELLRIVRKVAQYFYPQIQTKALNEGFAVYTHNRLINDLYDEGILDEGAMMEYFTSHSNVVFQPDYNSGYYSGINPYALGFAIFKDIDRVATNPTDEDREWFRGHTWVGSGDANAATQEAVRGFKDESFIKQYLSPSVMRDLRLFTVLDDERDPDLEVTAIHNDRGYRTVREKLSKSYNLSYMLPDIQVHKVDRWGSRLMTLHHFMTDGIPLNMKNAAMTLEHLGYLWSYDVELQSFNGDELSSILRYSHERKSVDIEVAE